MKEKQNRGEQEQLDKSEEDMLSTVFIQTNTPLHSTC